MLGAILWTLICLFLQGVSLPGNDTHSLTEFKHTHTEFKFKYQPDDISVTLRGKSKGGGLEGVWRVIGVRKGTAD